MGINHTSHLVFNKVSTKQQSNRSDVLCAACACATACGTVQAPRRLCRRSLSSIEHHEALAAVADATARASLPAVVRPDRAAEITKLLRDFQFAECKTLPQSARLPALKDFQAAKKEAAATVVKNSVGSKARSANQLRESLQQELAERRAELRKLQDEMPDGKLISRMSQGGYREITSNGNREIDALQRKMQREMQLIDEIQRDFQDLKSLQELQRTDD
eukprot:GHVT01039425.1.p2 GENE.GHVT01039425.1~~GHVT01039425.1.p2  ORF type:complete len:219 (+),score=22.42 GHVT01039425.1:3299-3955(+)